MQRGIATDGRVWCRQEEKAEKRPARSSGGCPDFNTVFRSISRNWSMAVLPIITYNDNALRKEALKIKGDSTELQKLIDDMFDTMYNSNGVGLAAPQIGQNIRLFVLDTDAMTEEIEGAVNYGPIVFINPEIIEEGEENTIMEEGCLRNNRILLSLFNDFRIDENH